MSQNDPTDQTLAAIASLLDHPASPRGPEIAGVEEKTGNHDNAILESVFQEPAFPESVVSSSAVSSSVVQEPDGQEPDGQEPDGQEPALHEPVLHEPVSIAHDPRDMEADGYFKYGPGPLAAIRFKWTARRENDDAYYVDETIGENATPVVTGPMTADAAVQLVNDRESEARQRFEQIKSEMTVRSMASNLVETNSGKG